MFALHETTRKRVCRLAFFALCVAPTLTTAAWIGGHRSPGRKGRMARELSESFDVHVKLADWREPRPRMIRSRGVSLSDRRSGLALAEITALESRTVGAERIVTAASMTTECGQLATLAEKVSAWLANLPPEGHEIHVDKLALKSPRQSEADEKPGLFELQQVRGRIDRDAAGRVQARFEGRLIGARPDGSQAIRLTLEPSSDKESPAAIVTLQTQGVAVPAWVLAAVAPGLNALGAKAQFQGTVRWLLERPDVRGSVQGRLENVNVAAVLPNNSPHSLRGNAVVELTDMHWQGRRLKQLNGSVRVENAAASRSLVDAAVKHLLCVQASDGPAAAAASGQDGDMVALDLLACRFLLDGKGLTLSGECQQQAGWPKGCLAVSGLRPLLLEPPYVQLPLGAWVQFVSAPGASWLPATREAVETAERLPLPTSPKSR
jgi:hypothetical protein